MLNVIITKLLGLLVVVNVTVEVKSNAHATTIRSIANTFFSILLLKTYLINFNTMHNIILIVILAVIANCSSFLVAVEASGSIVIPLQVKLLLQPGYGFYLAQY